MVISKQTNSNILYPLLKSLSLFKGISDHLLLDISSHCSLKTLRTQDLMVSQGEILNKFFIVLAGELEVYTQDEHGEKIILDRLSSGDYYGEICLLTGEPSPVCISTAKKSQIIIFEDRGFENLIQWVPELNHKVIKTLSSQLIKVNDEIFAARNKELSLASFIIHSRNDWHELVGQSKFTKILRHKIDEIARHNEPVLILGEKGTGKILAANLIHTHGMRNEKPFIVVECEELAKDEEGNKLLGPLAKMERLTDGFSYLDLAQGGTLFLNDIELLPKGALLRLMDYVNRSREVRILMASTVSNPTRYIEKKFPGIVCNALFRNLLYLEPLRNRKRDIPELLNHFVALKSKKYEKQGLSLSPAATEKLLYHDYQQANVRELEEIIDRAVLLTNSSVIEAETIILGEVIKSNPGYNLLQWGFLKNLIHHKIWPHRAQQGMSLIFIGILFFTFTGNNSNLWINTFTWKFMGPMIILVSLLLARISCSICPFAFLASKAQEIKCYARPVPDIISKNYYLFFSFLFSLIFWYEEFFDIKDVPYLTGLLLLAISAAAITCGLLFRGQIWCRYLCPLGAIFAVCSTLSPVELRAKTDICQNKCQTFNCYKGDTRTGCPMLQHAAYLDSNMNCKLCFKCVLNCPNDSIRFSLRPPGREIWRLSNVHGGMAALVLFFGLMLLPLCLLPEIKNTYPQHWKWVFNFSYWTLFLLLTAFVVLFLKKRVLAKNFVPYLRMSLAFIPLITGSHISYQLGTKFSPLKNYLVQLSSLKTSSPLLTTTACYFLQAHFMVIGLLFTGYCLTKISPKVKNKWLNAAAFFLALGYFTLVLLLLA
ncbi:sigma 54-interacting transcriptional regulator [Desulforamulus ruminis]|uniref:sigma 54-interacting transcriptional regulator n=1 Tax=Desulforamulus ruminis TaxID=1564 RepID=UPI0023556BCF|nr:sigma 54-interacting transcriptional regulator [Desulforamulus ruminis]